MVHANPLVAAIGKPPEDFTRRDLLKLIARKGIRSIHFRYPAIDGKLKELKLPVNDLTDAEAVLAEGERVDGSSLFKGMVDAGRSDMYVVPMYRTAFLHPFVPDCLVLLCRFIDQNGRLAALTPDNVLSRAEEALKADSGLSMLALGELEFYAVYPDAEDLYPGTPQAFYHESSPWVKLGDLSEEILRAAASICGGVKYCHSEVGYIGASAGDLPQIRGKRMSQYELEFLPAPPLEMAGRLLTAKWLIRNFAARRGILVTFAPKLSLGDAGSGLHIHTELVRGGRNALVDAKGSLTPAAFGLIGGLLRHAGSLTAFGNTCAASYLRLVPHQEAPVRVCWSAANRSALVRVPLGWRGIDNLASRVNPRQRPDFRGAMFGQTVELRSPDGSADVYLLLAGLAVAIREGLADPKSSRRLVDRCNVATNIFTNPKALSRLEALPRSCWESAQSLERQRGVYESRGVFPPEVVDFCLKRLAAEKDQGLARSLARQSQAGRAAALRKVMFSSLHCM
ncbi:MAG: glutamine synthetase family protein [Elusimicrobiota bacterium]|jgi:glutamine synthetase